MNHETMPAPNPVGVNVGRQRDVLDFLRALERQSEDSIWRTAKEAREEIERLRAERDELMAAVREAIPAGEHPKEETPSNWAWQIRSLGADRRAAYRLAGLTPNA